MRNFKEFLRQWIVPPKIVTLFLVSKGFVKNFSLTNKYLLKQSRTLKNKHTGSSCFVLGSGSSLKSQDIKKLKFENVISVSNSFVHPDFSIIKPRYHAVPPLIGSHGELYSEKQFVKWLKVMEAKTGQAEMFFYIGDRQMIESNNLFQNRIVHWVDYTLYTNSSRSITLDKIYQINTVSELAITIALYLGFDKIYLLGIDHDWFNGPLVYFYDYKKNHELSPNQDKLSIVDSEFQMRRHADIFKRYKYLFSIKKNIYNANSNSKNYIDVFPKVDYNLLFNKSGITRSNKS